MRQDVAAAPAPASSPPGPLARLRRALLAAPANTGLVAATLFFAASLTPSLTPRITIA